MASEDGRGAKERRFLEIACFNVASALAAAEAGADRIELCAGAELGGTTPTVEDLELVKRTVKVPVNVMIRPRGGSFLYTPPETVQMEQDIKRFKPSADGFVFGILDEGNGVDSRSCRKLLDLAHPKPCTFHRAFDEITDLACAMQNIADLGFAAVLTSGGQANAVAGAEKLATLITTSRSQSPKVIVGGGVRSPNIASLMKTTQAQWFHSSAVIDESGVASADEVRKLLEILREP